MKRLLKKIRGAVVLLKDNAIPIMSFLIVVLALRPYCYSIRGYYAIGGEYILALLCAIAVGAVMKKQEQSDYSQKAQSGFCERGTTEQKMSIGNNAIKSES